MSRHIRIYVKNELFRGNSIPLSSNRRFHPTLKDIRNHMYKTVVKLQFSKLDQANIDVKIQQWKQESPDDHFYFRGYGEQIDEKEEETDAENMFMEDDGDVIVRKFQISFADK